MNKRGGLQGVFGALAAKSGFGHRVKFPINSREQIGVGFLVPGGGSLQEERHVTGGHYGIFYTRVSGDASDWGRAKLFVLVVLRVSKGN